MKRRIIASALFSLVAFGAVADEEEVDAIEMFGDWSVFVDSGDCWIATTLEFKASATGHEVVFFVTFHNRSPEVNLSIHSRADIDFDADLDLVIRGKAFDFEGFDGFAYPQREDEMTIFQGILAGNSAQIRFTNPSGRIVSGFASNDGFRDAYNYLARKCDFFRFDGPSEEAGVEPT